MKCAAHGNWNNINDNSTISVTIVSFCNYEAKSKKNRFLRSLSHFIGNIYNIS